MRRRLTLSLVVLGAVAALVVTSVVQAAPSARKKLSGFDGPGFVIGMSKRTVSAGQFRITINDKSGIHNFHLIGPGINRRTGVAFVGTVKWNVTLQPGTYRFICDPHAATMKGTLRVT
jgi:plastocyanin